jgi:hypothetical protein
MKIAGITLLTMIYYGTIIVTAMRYGMKVDALVLLASCCVASVIALVEKDEPENEPERESCEGCKNNLGGGHCRINVEGECREGGGFELYKSEED